MRVFFHFAKDSGVTGVKFEPNLWRWRQNQYKVGYEKGIVTSTSRNSSRLMTLAFAASSAAFFWDLSTKPGGSAWRYWQLSPFGHSQNQPNFCDSIAWMKCLHTIWKGDQD